MPAITETARRNIRAEFEIAFSLRTVNNGLQQNLSWDLSLNE
jgi:hypothetical protein